MMLNIKEMILFKFVVMNDRAEWLWISTIINMYRLEWLPNWKMFCKVLKKNTANYHFLPVRLGMWCLYICLDGYVLTVVLVMALPMKNLYARLVCPQEYTATYSRAIFFSNPMMQNKMCMWKLTNSLLTIAWVWNMICF